MNVLLLEDDIELSKAIQYALEAHDYIVDCCHDGETAMLYALTTGDTYDIAIIDRMLPIIDGMTIIRAMRQKQIFIPVIIITGMAAIENRIEGLDGGGDDYLVKPFHIEELLARIRALVRRPPDMKEEDSVIFGDLSLNPSTRELSSHTKTLMLTAKESALMLVLMHQHHHCYSKEQLLSKIWGLSSDVAIGNVDNYISFLRKRLREVKSICVIKTIYGAGYLLVYKHAG